MPIVEWKSEYLLNIDQIDEHHRHLFDLLNKTYDSFVAGDSERLLADLFDELVDYATYHFATEEVVMKASGYPQYEQHHELHQKFCLRISEIQNDYMNGRSELSLEILSFLKNWITDHVLVKDAQFGHYVVNKS